MNAGGTELVDLDPGVSSSNSTNIHLVNGVIYFVASAEDVATISSRNITVPVKWLDFKSILHTNKQVELVWKTTNEINNRHLSTTQMVLNSIHCYCSGENESCSNK
jgi:hypothetical protein